MRRLIPICVVPAMVVLASAAPVGASAALRSTPDYPLASWVPADPANYSYGNRPHDHPVDMIIIHDTEGSYESAIAEFQDPTFAASADYVVSDQGDITQMVQEHDIAWHAGNWDYNTRAIGIEHEGFAWTPGYYTTAMYQASAHLAASICSRWGVPMDRNHVIGHDEVPDPNNPGLFGGEDHHTDPGPYWDWSYYMSIAQSYASALPSPPHLGPDPAATNGNRSATVTWNPAHTCHTQISGYTVTAHPGNATMTLPPTATSATFTGLQNETAYTFTVSATNADGTDSLTSNTVYPGRCNRVRLSALPASPQSPGTTVTLTAGSSSCPNPLYRFWIQPPGGTWNVAQDYSASGTFTWQNGPVGGLYRFSLWARDAASPASYDGWNSAYYTLTTTPCTGLTVSASPDSQASVGSQVAVSGSAGGCPNPQYRFWIQPPGGVWAIAQDYSTAASYSWNTTGQATGTYRFSVWARDTSSPSTYDQYSTFYYTLAVVPCTGVSISAPTAASVGSTVKVGAAASDCSNPSYRFWLLPPNGTWTMEQDYSTSPTFNWDTTGQPTGTYRLSVWVRDASSSAQYDAYITQYLQVNPPACAAVSISSSPPSQASVGAGVTITGSATGCATPTYRFWVQAPNGQWTMVRDYSNAGSFTWNTTGLATGTYRFSVWAKDANSPSSYDVYNTQYFSLT